MTRDRETSPVSGDALSEASPVAPMRTKAASAARWSLIGVIGKQGIRAVLALALARILGPSAYGVVALATVFMAFMSVLLDQGVASTVIQRTKLSDHLVGTAVWMTVGVGLLLGGLTLLFADALGSVFHNEDLAPVLRVLTISVVLEALCVVPNSLLVRQLRLRALAFRDLLAATGAGAIALGAALNGVGYWAVVVQILVGDVLTLLVIMRLVGRLSLRANWAMFKEIWAFSSRVFLTQGLTFLVRNADNLVVARVLGPVALAYYAISYRTMLVPIQALAYSSSRVTLPIYSRLRDSPERFCRAFLGVARTLSMVSFPLMALCVVAAPIGVELVLGAAWQPAVATIQILAIAGAWQGVSSGFGSVFVASGRLDLALRFQFFNAAVTLSAFAVGVHWGIVGVATGFTAANFLMLIVAVLVLRKIIAITALGFARILLPSAASSLVLAGTWLAVESVVAGMLGSGLLSLCVATLVGLLAFVATYFLLWRVEAEDGLRTIALLIRAKEG